MAAINFHFVERGDGAVGLITDAPVACGECHAAHFFFVNRDGRTRCVGCDLAELKRQYASFIGANVPDGRKVLARKAARR